jgi:NAD(P)-dependent dehydrogenase (short-subunit alcohol dehydrogenase family)
VILGVMSESTGRVAVITGAGRGIGRCISEVLAAAGYRLALIDQVYPEETLKAVAASDTTALGICADVSSEHDVDSATTAIFSEFGRADVLVNNAGIGLIAPAEETTADQWRRILDVNLTGPFLVSRALGVAMLENGIRGSIVNIASIAGLNGIPDRSAYNASKHGLIGLTRTLALEWGARGVRVNAVCPAFVKTDMDSADQDSGAYTEADILERTPLGRFAVPEDVAKAVAFLADETKSGFINGAALPVDGGWSSDAGWRSLSLRKR